jgi:hypothetical protein
MPAPERLVVAALAVDRDPHVDFAAMQLLRSRGQRGLDRREHDFQVDALLTRDGVHKIKQIAVH